MAFGNKGLMRKDIPTKRLTLVERLQTETYFKPKTDFICEIIHILGEKYIGFFIDYSYSMNFEYFRIYICKTAENLDKKAMKIETKKQELINSQNQTTGFFKTFSKKYKNSKMIIDHLDLFVMSKRRKAAMLYQALLDYEISCKKHQIKSGSKETYLQAVPSLNYA